MLAGVVGNSVVTDVMGLISESLTVPVLVILLVFVAISIFILGTLVKEYFVREKVSVGDVSDLIYRINSSADVDELKSSISDSNIASRHKSVLLEIADSSSLSVASREALARKLIEGESKTINNRLRYTDIITRIGPTLGLMGTLIPMGPGLAALGAGDINTLATSLTLAFNTTIVGIGSGALCYVLGKIRKSWYDKYLADLDALSDAVLDYMD